MSDSINDSLQSEIDRRQYSRIEFDADVTVSQGDESYHTELVDISLNGVLIATPAQYQVRTDKPCLIVIRLSADAVIKMHVALVHSSTATLGFQCTSIDMESIVVLRRLIEINLDDPAASERVLSELLLKQQAIS